jgi:prophage tail gpP-like protein
MSRSHRVVSGDTLGAISVRYLGTASKWRTIVTANPQLSSRRTASDGSPLIFPDDILAIPEEDRAAAPAAPQIKTIELSDSEGDISIVIDGYKFLGFTGYELNLNYDSFDSFSFSAPFDIATEAITEALAPFTFKDCEVYYNGELKLKGTLLTPDPEIKDGAKEITLQGYPLCGILNDCTIPLAQYPAEYSGLTLEEIAGPIGDAFGIKVFFDGNPGGAFEKVSIEPTEKILDFLVKLSKQRSLLFNNDADGRLVFFEPKQGPVFMSFEEGKSPLMSLKPKFKAQGFYSHIIGFSKADADHESDQFIYENKFLTKKGITRCITIIADDADPGSLEASVKSYAGRMFADCVSYELECEEHINHDKKVFQKGMTVSIKAPGAMIARETNFTARNITLKRTVEGKTSTMNLVLPGSYTGEIPEALPWE